MNSLKNDPQEVKKVCKLMEEYGKWENKQLIFEMLEEEGISIEYACKKLNMTKAQILDEMEKEGYKIPSYV